MTNGGFSFEKTFNPGRGAGDATHAATLAPGDTLGQYKIISLLGRGGMGEVYEVEHWLGLSIIGDNNDHDTGPWPDEEESLMRCGQPTEDNAEPKPGKWLRYQDWIEANKEGGQY